MNTIKMEKITISELHEHIGGKTTTTNDFIVLRDYRWPQEIMEGPHRAEGSAVMLCISGSAKISVNMRKLNMQPGTVMMYGRESIVEFMDISPDCMVDLVFFSNVFIKETMLDLKAVLPIFKYITENESELITLDEQEITVMRQFYRLIYDVVDLGKSVIVRDLMTALMRTLGEFYNLRLTETQHIRTRQEEYLENFLRTVAIHHKKERSVKFYADALHITPKYLSTVIKEVSGKSAASWINDFVIQEAKVMLKFSGKSIQEITYELNFSTQSFFGKYFKRHTGVSPSEYRMSE